MQLIAEKIRAIQVYGSMLKRGLVQRVCTSPLAGHLSHRLFRRRDRLRGRDYAAKLLLPR